MAKQSKSFELRNVIAPPIPRYAVTEITDTGGEDIAWFYKLRDVAEYIKFKNSKAKKTKR